MDATNMDTQLLFYDTPQSQSTDSKKSDTTIPLERGLSQYFNEDSFSDLIDLDPSFESPYNIRDLTSKDGRTLFPELLPGAEHTTLTTNQQPVIEAQDTQMPVVQTSHDTSASHQEDQATEVIVVNPEDLASLGLTFGPDCTLIKLEESIAATDVSEEEVGNAPQFITLKEDDDSLSESVNSFDSSTTSLNLSSHLQSESVSSTDLRHRYKATAPSKTATRKHRQLDRRSEEYRDRRDRNNVAVRKSRDKTKARQRETEGRVHELTTENDRLQKKVDLLTKELTVLKGLFTNVGAALPKRLSSLLK